MLLRSVVCASWPRGRWLQAGTASFTSAAAASTEQLRLAASPRSLSPAEVQVGCIWLSGLIDRGVDSLDVDPGQEQADSLVAAALAAGVTDFDTVSWRYHLSSDPLDPWSHVLALLCLCLA